jgi:hypothetical protein
MSTFSLFLHVTIFSLDLQIKEIRELEGRLKNKVGSFPLFSFPDSFFIFLQIDFQMKQLDKIPRTEAASKRSTLGKLQKDFERIKTNVQVISSESALIKVSREVGSGEAEKFSRTGNGSSSGSSSGSFEYTYYLDFVILIVNSPQLKIPTKFSLPPPPLKIIEAATTTIPTTALTLGVVTHLSHCRLRAMSDKVSN